MEKLSTRRKVALTCQWKSGVQSCQSSIVKSHQVGKSSLSIDSCFVLLRALSLSHADKTALSDTP